MSPLVALVVPHGIIEAAGVVLTLAASWPHLRAEAELLDWEGTRVEEPCPDDMVEVDGSYCIDRLPWPNEEGVEPLLGVSAIPEGYLETRGATWDCESLCDSRGKRLCTWWEWSRACEGTPEDECGPERKWLVPDWARIMRRESAEMRRLDQHAHDSDYPACESRYGARMMTTVEEWVTLPGGRYAFSRGFWSRPAGCGKLNPTHAPNWHDYATACRCCTETDL